MTKERILLLGKSGLFGYNFINFFKNSNQYELITISKSDLNLRNQEEVFKFFKRTKPNIVLNAAALVGGIKLNLEKPTDLILDNLEISINVLRASLIYDVFKVINFGSNCMYPVNANQPLHPSSLWTGGLEITNKSYAIYKLASLEIVNTIRSQYNKNWLTIIPSTIYGPNDNFSFSNGHVLSSLIRKFHEAKLNRKSDVTLWGDGSPLREFIYIDDLLRAVKILIENDLNDSVINIGSGIEKSIKELALDIAQLTNYDGQILWDKSKPNGNPRKILDSSQMISLGWSPQVEFSSGLDKTYKWFTDTKNSIRI